MRKSELALIIFVVAVLFGCIGKTERIKASGTVEVKEVDVSSRISSRVEKLFAEEGSEIKAGQPMAQLDNRMVLAQLDAARAMFDVAKTNFERSRNLFQSNSITKEQFDNARAQFIKAESDLIQSKVMYDEASLSAPWDGVILKRNVEVGELVSVNAPIFTIGDLQNAKVTIYVSLVDMEKIKLKNKARVNIDAFPDRWFEGTVTRIAQQAEFTPKNVQTRDERVKEVFAIEITVPNSDGILKPGMPADVEVEM